MGRTSEPIEVAQLFGRRVRTRRQSHGWTIEDLAERSGLHWTYVGSVERGERNVSLVNIVRLASGLRVDPAVLVRKLKP